MNKYQTFKALFYALDAEYDDSKDEKLGDYLSGMNPFLFKGEGSADPSVYGEFSSVFESLFKSQDKELELDEAYEFSKLFLERSNEFQVLDFFLKTSKDSWIQILSKSEI